MNSCDICEKLHNIVRNGKRFDRLFDMQDIPDDGVYIVFENGEEGHNGERIVRVGINKKRTLKERLIEHYLSTDKDKSIFIKHVGRAIIEDKEAVKKWNRKNCKDAPVPEYELKASEYIQANTSFIVINVPDKKYREELEKRLIYTVSSCNKCVASDNWLGKKSTNKSVVMSGMWNCQHVYRGKKEENLLDEADLRYISENLVYGD